MDPSLILQPGTIDAYTYIPFIADTKWYNVAKEKYNPIYVYRATIKGIKIIKIKPWQYDSVPCPAGFKPTEPNAITVYFPDTSNEGLSPYGSTREHIIFDMDPATQIPQVFTLLSIVRSDSPNPVPELIHADASQPIWPGTPSQTALSHPLLRELLLVITLRSFVFQGYRLAPRAQELVKHIALTGPPVVPRGVQLPLDELPFVSEFHRTWIWTDEGSRWAFTPPELRLRGDVEAALVRNGWRDPKIAVDHLDPPPPPPPRNDENNKGNSEDDGTGRAVVLAGLSDLVDALLYVGYLDTDDKRADVLTKVAKHGTLQDVKSTLAKIDRENITLAHECVILPAAVAGGKGRAEVLKFLLESGLDPNVVSKGEKSKQRTALHMAIQHGDVDMVKVLLEAGAKMVKDEEWGLPIQAAKSLVDRGDGACKVAIIERWLEERRLPKDHADLPVFIDDDMAGFSGVGWAS